jgi:isopentenyl-diphosphate delta-isomerase
MEDVYLVPNSIPELDLAEIDTGVSFLGKTMALPLIINAMTGGIEESGVLNRDLSELAAEFNIGIAVGSQTIALENREAVKSFRTVREVNPQGLVIANIGADVKPDDAVKVVEMLAADGLQLHLNVAQELAMPEGERNFRGMLDNIAEVVSRVRVPVIAKEVGFGIARESFLALYQNGVRFFDTGGQGGTNFIAIENARGGLLDGDFLYWGIPTAASVAEIVAQDLPVDIIATGGIKSALEAAKAIALGSTLVGGAGHFLRLWSQGSKIRVLNELEKFSYQFRCALLMAGASNLGQLKLKPVIIGGNTAHWLSARGIDINRWSRRSSRSG